MEICKTCGLPYKLYKPYMGGNVYDLRGDQRIKNNLRTKILADIEERIKEGK